MFLYFAQASDGEKLVKIGFARNAEKRVANLQTGSPSRLKIIGKIRLPSEASARHWEKRTHRAFAAYRKHGEWFSMCKHISDFIEKANTVTIEAAIGAATKATPRPRPRRNKSREKLARYAAGELTKQERMLVKLHQIRLGGSALSVEAARLVGSYMRSGWWSPAAEARVAEIINATMAPIEELPEGAAAHMRDIMSADGGKP